MIMAAANRLLRSSTLALIMAAAFCAVYAAAQSTSPALPSATAGMPSGDQASAGPGATQPAAATTTALPPSSSAGASTTASKKFPLPAAGGGGEYHPAAGGGGGAYDPAAEVGSALPVPTPDEWPSAGSLGFGGLHGDECCGGGGYGWFGGPGGFGPGTYGYNGPLYFGAAPARSFGNVAANVLLPLAVACVSAAMCV